MGETDNHKASNIRLVRAGSVESLISNNPIYEQVAAASYNPGTYARPHIQHTCHPLASMYEIDH